MNKLTASALAAIAILTACFLGQCFAWYVESCAAFKGAIG